MTPFTKANSCTRVVRRRHERGGVHPSNTQDHSPVLGKLEEDKRATTNVSFLKKSLNFKKSPGGNVLKKCGKVWKSKDTI